MLFTNLDHARHLQGLRDIALRKHRNVDVIALMRRLGQTQVIAFNRCHRRTGTPWKCRRFKSSRVDSDHWLLTAYGFRTGFQKGHANKPNFRDK